MSKVAVSLQKETAGGRGPAGAASSKLLRSRGQAGLLVQFAGIRRKNLCPCSMGGVA